MSTQIREVGKMVEVSVLTAPGKRKKIPRACVLVPRGDKDALRNAIVAAAEQARREFGIKQERG